MKKDVAEKGQGQMLYQVCACVYVYFYCSDFKMKLNYFECIIDFNFYLVIYIY